MTRTFPTPVTNTGGMQKELWENPAFKFWGAVLLSLFVLSKEGREDHSNKSHLSDVLKVLMVNNGVQSSGKQAESKQRAGKKYCTEERFSNNSA